MNASSADSDRVDMKVGSIKLTSVVRASALRNSSTLRFTLDVTSAIVAEYKSHWLPNPPENDGTESAGALASKSWKKSTSLETMTRCAAALFAWAVVTKTV